MKLVKYLGLKSLNVDRVFDSGMMWRGEGDVQEVHDDELADKLVRHFPTVYKIVQAGENKKFQRLREVVEEDTDPLVTIKIPDTDGTMVSIGEATYMALHNYVTEKMGLKVPESANRKELMNQIQTIVKFKEEIVRPPAVAQIKQESSTQEKKQKQPKPKPPKKNDIVKQGLAMLAGDEF